MEEKLYNYVYLTTNLINGKQYVGDHSTNNLDHKRTRNYFGSGKLIILSIKKHGKSNFKKEILEFFPSKAESFKNQEKYIQLYKTQYPDGYNLSPLGGNCVAGCHAEESKRKIGDSNRGDKNGMYGKVPSEKSISKWKESHKNFKHSDETKLLMSKKSSGENNSMFGKSAWAAINNIRKKCEYCGKETNVGNYGKSHGEKCKSRIII
jgi:hypothetical protein